MTVAALQVETTYMKELLSTVIVHTGLEETV